MKRMQPPSPFSIKTFKKQKETPRTCSHEVTEKHIAKRAVAGFDAGTYSLAFSGAIASPGEEARKFPKVIQKRHQWQKQLNSSLFFFFKAFVTF